MASLLGGLADRLPQHKSIFLYKAPLLAAGCFTCAGHDTLTANRKEVNLKPAVIGRKGNAKKGQGHIQKWRV